MPTWSLEAPSSWAKRGRKMTEVSMAILASRVASPAPWEETSLDSVYIAPRIVSVPLHQLNPQRAQPLTPTDEGPRIRAFVHHSFVTYVLAQFLDNSKLCSKHSLSEHFLKKKITAFNEGGWPWSGWGRAWRWSFRLG